MADYNSIHTGAQIDEAVGRALSGRAGINPNLLDNWYFGNPVDQRGGYVVPPGTPYFSGNTQAGTTTTYVKVDFFSGSNYPHITVNGADYATAIGTAVRGYTGTGYTIDRWRTHGNSTVTIGSDSLAFFAAGDANIVQPLENALKEDTLLTFSVLNKAGTVYIRIRDTEWGDYGVAQRTGDGVVAVTGTIPKGKIPMVQFYNSQGENIAVKAAKLELGSQQTLAHQENGVWVLNEIPDYGEQLAKCQRYYQKYDNFVWMIPCKDNVWRCNIVFPVQMRANPAVVSFDTTADKDASITVDQLRPSGASAYGTSDANYVALSNIVFDANL